MAGVARVGSVAIAWVLASLSSCGPRNEAASAGSGNRGTGAVHGFALVVADPASERAFWADALGFAPGAGHPMDALVTARLFGEDGVALRMEKMHAGRETLGLLYFGGLPSRPIPEESRGNDLWFQYPGIVVSDMDAAYKLATSRGARPITADGPRTIALSGAATDLARAVFLRDPERHPFELVWYSPGTGDPRWQAQTGSLLLGIGHAGMTVHETERSVAFYREVCGLDVVAERKGAGDGQGALMGVPGASVRVTTLRGIDGPWIELVEFMAPGDGQPVPGNMKAGDLLAFETTIGVADPAHAAERARSLGGTLDSRGVPIVDGRPTVRVRDPDGHVLRLYRR